MLAFPRQHVVRPVVLAALAAFVLGVPGTVAAQTSPPAKTKSTWTAGKKHARGGAGGEQKELSEHLQMMTQRLKLTDDQVARVKVILQEQMTASNELRARYKGQPATPESRAAMEKAHKELHAGTDAKLAEVLTADQMTEYKKMWSEHMKKSGMKEEKEEEAKEGGK